MKTEKPWLSEPDIWQGLTYTGNLVYQMKRHPAGHWWCGYVELPGDHPWHNCPSYDDIPVDVHGGLTYWKYRILPGDKKRSYIGFDCAHLGDYPADQNGTYPTFGYVMGQCEKLAEQIWNAYYVGKHRATS